MDFLELIDSVTSFAQNSPVIAIIIALALLIFFYSRPKLFFTLLFLGLFLAGVYYMITRMAGSGSEQKRRLLQENNQSDNAP